MGSVLLLTVVGVLRPAPVHTQQAPVPPSACYVPGSGTLYLIKATNTPSTCREGHVAFTLAPSTAGPQLGPGGNSLPTNGQGAYDFSNPNGFVAAYTFGPGNIPMTGPGTRVMWYPFMAAFRAGVVSGIGANYWDNGNTGLGSVAFGYNTKATGQYSLAAGTHTTASGKAGFAMGDQSEASGAASFAVGQTAKASGSNAIALGRDVLAGGGQSVALGYLAQATSSVAVAIGFGAQASGLSSTAIGSAKSSGNTAIAIGNMYTNATADLGMAIGHSVEASGVRSTAMGHYVSTNGKKGAFVIGDASGVAVTSATADNQFAVRAQGIWFGKSGNATATSGRYIETSTGAYLSSGGAWVSSSDSTKKHRWHDVDGEDVLSRLAAMPVRSWSYREEGDSVRHMGPTAQDFRDAFGLGDTDKAIAGVDADGVALAAVQALIRRTAELRGDNDALRRDNAELRTNVERMRNELDQVRALVATLTRENR
jgi:hypothetical protein